MDNYSAFSLSLTPSVVSDTPATHADRGLSDRPTDPPLSPAPIPHYMERWGLERHISPPLLALNASPWDGIEDVATPEGQWQIHSVLLPWLETFKPYKRLGEHGRNQYVTQGTVSLAEKYASPGFFIEGVDPATGLPIGDRQLRLEHSPKDGPKYLRPPGGTAKIFFAKVDPATCDLIAERHELPAPDPAEFWGWVKANNLPIVLVEGAGDAMGALSRGIVAIGAPGHQMCCVRETSTLKPELLWILEGCPRVTIAFDQDVKEKTRLAVEGSRYKVAGALGALGCKVSVAVWEASQGKGFGDLAPGHQDAALKGALPMALYRTLGYSQLTREPSLVVNERYLSVEIPANPLVCIKSQKGTGKTERLIPLVDAATRNGVKVLPIVHRIQLGQAVCDRLGIPYVAELRGSSEGSLMGYGLCLDSLHRASQAQFRPEEWRGCVVILDEADQLLWHLLNSSTCQENRPAIIKNFLEILGHASQVIALDADLSDPVVDFLEDATGNPAYLIRNDWIPGEDQAWDCYSYPKAIDLFQKLDQAVRLGQRLMVLTQSKKPKARYRPENIERRILKINPEARVLVMTSETVADPHHPAYGAVANLNKIIADYDYVISTPVIETGLSVDIRGHFEAVYGFFPGVTPEPSVRQAMARLREPVPRHFYAATYGGSIGSVAGGHTTVRGCIEGAKAVTHKALVQLEWDKIEDQITGVDDRLLTLWGKMAARVNAGLLALRFTLESNLAKEGHRVYGPEPVVMEPGIFTGTDQLKDDLQVIRDEGWDESCQDRANARILTDSEAANLDKARSMTKEERDALDRYHIEKAYCLPISPELARLDDDGLYPKLRLFYFLSMGREHLPRRDKAAADAALEHGGGKLWIPDVPRIYLGHRVAALEALNIPALIADPDREFRGADPDLVAWNDRVIHCRFDIKKFLGVGIALESTPIQSLAAILDTIGIGLECSGRDRVNGKAAGRVYKVVPRSPLELEVLDAWVARDAALADTHTPEGAIPHYPALFYGSIAWFCRGLSGEGYYLPPCGDSWLPWDIKLPPAISPTQAAGGEYHIVPRSPLERELLYAWIARDAAQGDPPPPDPHETLTEPKVEPVLGDESHPPGDPPSVRSIFVFNPEGGSHPTPMDIPPPPGSPPVPIPPEGDIAPYPAPLYGAIALFCRVSGQGYYIPPGGDRWLPWDIKLPPAAIAPTPTPEVA